MEQLLNYIGEFFRKRLAHFGAGVFRRHRPAYLDETVESDVVEVFHLLLGLFQFLELTFRVIYQCAEAADFFVAHRIVVYFVYLAPDIPRSVPDDMVERLIFAVDIGYKMFGTLRQIQYRLQVYDLGGGGADRRKTLTEEFQHTPVAPEALPGNGVLHFRNNWFHSPKLQN